MALPSSGKISLGNVNTELGLTSTAQISLGATGVRALYNVASGAIRLAADGYGKANRVALSRTFSINELMATVTASSLSGYIAGKTDLTITVNSGIYVYSTSTTVAALTITGAAAGDKITLVNNGYIMGMGGASADVTSGTVNPGLPGGPAISLGYNIFLTNNSYIGGGGGGGSNVGVRGTGGGGAGGAKAGNEGSSRIGGSGGGPGQIGGTGTVTAGGGGGRIMPGVGGAGGAVGSGGGAGGGGGNANVSSSGGSAGNTGNSATGDVTNSASSGGGGWGAKGGNAIQQSNVATGGAGGSAIALNTYTVTYITTGTIYGVVS
jgi:hypothetical protein